MNRQTRMLGMLFLPLLAALGACSLVRPVNGYDEEFSGSGSGGGSGGVGGGRGGASPKEPSTSGEPSGGDEKGSGVEGNSAPAAAGEVGAKKEFLYVIGGSVQEDTNLGNVYYAEVFSDGSLGEFVGTTPLPYGLRGHSATVVGDSIYVFGGEIKTTTASATLSSAVFVGRVEADGRIPKWVVLDGALPAGRASQGTIVMGSKVLLVRGIANNTSGEKSDVSVAFSKDGTLGPWKTAGFLDGATQGQGAVAVGQWIFTVGGKVNGAFSRAVSGYPLEDGGTMGKAVAQAPLPRALAFGGTVAIGDDIYVVGGLQDGSSGSPSNGVRRAHADASGKLSEWVSLEPFADPRCLHGTTVKGKSIYVVGGRGSQADFADVQVGQLDAGGKLSWRRLPQTLPRRLWYPAVVAFERT